MPPKDDRVTLKMDRTLWRTIEDLIKAHPEWCISSVSEFVRRAVDSEVRMRTEEKEKRVITLRLAPAGKNKRRRGR